MLTPFVTTLMIGFGGGMGAATRFLIYFFLDRGRLWPQWKILLCINLLGSLTIGYLSGFLLKMHGEYSHIITDVLLPRMNGFQLVEQLKSNPETSTVPVIMMSAVYVTDEDMAMAKLKATEVLAFIADEAIQIHGG